MVTACKCIVSVVRGEWGNALQVEATVAVFTKNVILLVNTFNIATRMCSSIIEYSHTTNTTTTTTTTTSTTTTTTTLDIHLIVSYIISTTTSGSSHSKHCQSFISLNLLQPIRYKLTFDKLS